MKKKDKIKAENPLNDALLKSYIARAKLFYSVLQGKNIENLFSRIKECSVEGILWVPKKVGISEKALSIINKASIDPVQVFCHPEILRECPDLLEYYRNFSALSQKGLNQMLSGRLPKSRKISREERYHLIAEILNKIISSVIIDTDGFSLSLAKDALIAELGTEIQGTWVNMIGKGAAKAVEGIIYTYVEERGFLSSEDKKAIKLEGKKQKQIHLILKNGWRIVFSSEPDIAILNSKDRLKVAIEIKGSMDKAGAQTRLGEAKKSFAKAKSEDAHCLTIYLASCYTEAVLSQLKTDREIDMHFNLIDILADEKKKQKFLKELFHYQIRIE